MKAGVAGASGYAGGELLRLLWSHPDLDVAVATADRSAGRAVADVAPGLAAAYPSLRLDATTPEAFAGCDVVFLALSHGASAPLVAALGSSVPLVVDLGADLRLADAATWARCYGGEHPAPGLLGTAVPGLVERHRDALGGARRVAVPGCYPTAAVLALAPLVESGLAGRGAVVVDAMSGASGAGASPSALLHLPALAGDVTAYGLEGHRHTPEMEAELGVPVCFTPHLVPIDRGLLATCHAQAAEGVTTESVLEALHTAYDHEPFVNVVADPPRPKAVRGTNVALVSAVVDRRSGQLTTLCAIDNLGKGAAGQAIQAANVALGLDETAGLTVAGVWP